MLSAVNRQGAAPPRRAECGGGSRGRRVGRLLSHTPRLPDCVGATEHRIGCESLYPDPIVASDQQEAWAQRAALFRDRQSGVLFVGLPDRVNGLVHRWHERILREAFLPNVPEGATVLDLGCGYGRLSESVARLRPDIELFGLDFVHLYCKLYASNIAGSTVQGDAGRLPFRDGAFDAVFSVTTLMYVRKSVRGALSEISRVLSPGGIALLVEPGSELQRVVGWFARFRRRAVRTISTGFTRTEFSELWSAAREFSVSLSGDNMRFTMFLPLLLAIRRTSALSWIETMTAEGDTRPHPQHRFALHRWMVIKRDSTARPE